MDERNENTRRPWWTLMDKAVGIVFALFAIIALLNLWNSQLLLWDRYGPGPTFVPYIVASILLAICIPMIISRNRVDIEQFGAAPLATAQYIITVILLVFLFPLLGAYLSIGIFTFLECIWVEKFTVRRAFFVALLLVLMVWLVFSLMLSVPFPNGPFDLEDWWR